MIPTTLRFFWPSTAASIPANWVRDTDYDGYYLHVATGDTAGTTGGSATHTHTESSHTHTFTAGAGSGAIIQDYGIEIKKPCAYVTHTHSSTVSNSATETLGTASNAPSYYEIIVIKPNDSSRAGVPDDAWALWDDDSGVPTNWTAQAGANSRLLKAAGTGADGGGTGGDSGSHSHSPSASHSHAAKNSNSATGSYYRAGTDGAGNHAHSVSLDSNTGANTSTDAAFPAYDTLAIIQNDTGGEDLPAGVIGGYGGVIASIPADWEQVALTAGYDMIMGTGTLGNIGTTGGARTHGHTGNNHRHAYTAGSATVLMGTNAIGLNWKSSAGHTHTWTIGDTSPVINDTSAREHYPSYIELILLKYVPASLRLRTLMGVGL